jgi:hypothetical protein
LMGPHRRDLILPLRPGILHSTQFAYKLTPIPPQTLLSIIYCTCLLASLMLFPPLFYAMYNPSLLYIIFLLAHLMQDIPSSLLHMYKLPYFSLYIIHGPLKPSCASYTPFSLSINFFFSLFQKLNSLSNVAALPALLWWITLYLEYQSVCPFVRIGSTHPLSPQEVCLPIGTKGVGNTLLRVRDGGGGANSDDLERKPGTPSTLCYIPSFFLCTQASSLKSLVFVQGHTRTNKTDFLNFISVFKL